MRAPRAGASESITLPDGRTLCFARYGASGGRPVIYLHGAASSRIEGELYDQQARTAGVQIIATDRPGCGGSSPAPGRTFPSYALDLQELADTLDIEQFVVAGMSNGGAYAIAAATRLPERVTSTVLINASTPLYDPIARQATPLRIRLMYSLARCAAPVTRWLLNRVANSAKADDRARRSAREVMRQTDSGYLSQEIQLASTHWSFDHIAVAQPVDIFTGDRDPGYLYARIWAERLPAGRLHVFRGGHADFEAKDTCERIVAALACAS